MFASPAYAQAAGATSQGGISSLLPLAVPWVLIIGIFWLLVWRPQSKAQKAQRARIDAAKKGDTVVTGGGLIGKVVKVDGDRDRAGARLECARPRAEGHADRHPPAQRTRQRLSR